MNVKKLLATAFATAAICTLSAQNQGEWIVGGSFGIENSKSTVEYTGVSEATSAESRTVTVLPSLHYFISDEVAVGVGFGIVNNKTFTEFNAYTNTAMYDKTNLFLIEPSAYYYVKITNKLFYTPQAYVSFATGKVKSDFESETAAGVPYVDVNDNTNVTHFGIGVRLAHFEYLLSEKFSVSADLGVGGLAYQTNKIKDTTLGNESILKTNEFALGLNNGSSVMFALKYRF